MTSRVSVLEGDLTEAPPLPDGLDAVVHCAGDVSFDPPVDQGFATNVVGTRDLLARIDEALEREGRGPTRSTTSTSPRRTSRVGGAATWRRARSSTMSTSTPSWSGGWPSARTSSGARAAPST